MRKDILRLPPSVNSPATPDLALLQDDHTSPLRVVGAVNVPARLDADTSPLTDIWVAVHGWDINVLAGVELEGRFRAQRLEVHAALWVVERAELGELVATGVELDALWVWVHDEAVVDLGLGCAEGEGLALLDAWEGCDLAGWDVG